MESLFTITRLNEFSKFYCRIFIQSMSVIFIFSNIVLSQTIFSQNWESGIGYWYADNGLWEVGVPTVGPSATHSGVNCAGTNLNGNYPPSANTRFISPPINLPTPNGNEKIQLKFWQWYSTEDNYDKCVIQVSEKSGPWETISDDIFEGSSTAWTQYIADLASYAGSSVRIGFYFTSNTGNGVSSGWYIDDISIQTEEVNFPNPEDFETGTGNWYADNGLWEIGVPTVGPSTTHSGVNCAGTNLNGNYPPAANTRLISPEITLTPLNGKNPMLFFYQWYSTEKNYDICYVQISVDHGDWQTVSNPISGSNPTWSQFGLDLSTFIDSTIRIGFYFTSNGGNGVSNGWYIDDIRIEGIVIVPVEFVSFSSKLINRDVKLEWSTATETNNKGFEIERRSENNEYQKIGFISGHGTTTEKQNYSFVDSKVTGGKYYYRLKQIDFDGTFKYSNEISVNISSPLKFALEQNYPNPFNPTTKINYQIPRTNFVTLKVYNVLGKEIATLVNEEAVAGSYEIKFNTTNLSSGIYFYRLKAGEFTETKKMVLLR